MGLKPLEYSDCLLDGPLFRDSIHDHEKELEEADQAIKSLIKECQSLIKALESKTFISLLLIQLGLLTVRANQ